MQFLSTAYLLREAIIAERREDRTKAAVAVPAPAPATKAAPVKTAPRPLRLVPPIFRLPLVATAGKTK